MSFITVAGENKIAAMIAAHTPLNITQFVFANIPSLGIEPVNRIEALPSAGYIVDTKTVANQGYVSPNKVVYSIILDSAVGDYQFNWVGLKDADGVLIACEHLPLTTKTKTAGLIQGNNLARNFLIEFNGAQSITGISTPASTWQFNFNNRLLQIDERERLSNFDTYGAAMFFDTGFLVTHSGLVCSMAAGLAFVGGVRCAKTAVSTLTVGSFPTDIYIDASLQGDISGVDAVIAFTASTTALVNYTDSLGFAHYVFKIAAISAGGVVTDLRPVFDAFATKKGVQNNSYNHVTAGGTADAITAIYTPAYLAWGDGMTLFVKIGANNTSNFPTVSPNGLTAKTIVKGAGADLKKGDLVAGMIAEFKYSATLDKVICQNPDMNNGIARLLGSLDYPTISTATNKATATPSTDAAGGKVTLTAGTIIELGKSVGTNGIMSIDTTTAFVSPSFAVSSTYYLRCMYVGDVLTFYVQKGTDTDAIPTGLTGTINGTSGGGFDSTVLDMLIAKIVTGSATTLPTVTPLANAKKLSTTVSFAANAGISDSSAVLTWARKPTVWLADRYGCGSSSAYLDADAWIWFTAMSRSLVSVNLTYYQWTAINVQYGNSSAATITLQG